MSDTPNIGSLPDVLRRVAEEIDLVTALTLARELGGTVVYLSGRPRPDSVIAQAVGLDTANRLAQIFGRGHIEIPLGPAADFSRKSIIQIRSMLAEGRGDQEIARTVRCHVKTVRRIRHGQRHQQLDLFDFITQAGP